MLKRHAIAHRRTGVACVRACVRMDKADWWERRQHPPPATPWQGLYSKQASRAANSCNPPRESTEQQCSSSSSSSTEARRACLFACGSDACFHHQQSHRMGRTDEEGEEIDCSSLKLSCAPHHLSYEVQQYLFRRAGNIRPYMYLPVPWYMLPRRTCRQGVRGAPTTTAPLCGDQRDPSVGGSSF